MWYSQILRHCKNSADTCSRWGHCLSPALTQWMNRTAVHPLVRSSPGFVLALRGDSSSVQVPPWIICSSLSCFSYLLIIFVNLSCKVELQVVECFLARAKQRYVLQEIRCLRDKLRHVVKVRHEVKPLKYPRTWVLNLIWFCCKCLPFLP